MTPAIVVQRRGGTRCSRPDAEGRGRRCAKQCASESVEAGAPWPSLRRELLRRGGVRHVGRVCLTAGQGPMAFQAGAQGGMWPAAQLLVGAGLKRRSRASRGETCLRCPIRAALVARGTVSAAPSLGAKVGPDSELPWGARGGLRLSSLEAPCPTWIWGTSPEPFSGPAFLP